MPIKPGDKVIVSGGDHSGKHGAVVRLVGDGGSMMVEVQLETVAETTFHRPGMLAKDRGRM